MAISISASNLAKEATNLHKSAIESELERLIAAGYDPSRVSLQEHPGNVTKICADGSVLSVFKLGFKQPGGDFYPML